MKLLVIMVGIPGAGKTTVRNRLFSDACVVCPDDAIGYTADRPWTPLAARAAWKDADRALSAALSDDEGPDVVVLDATNVARKRRRKYVDMARKAGAEAAAVVCVTDPDLCRERNAARDEFRRVPDEAMDRMVRNFQAPETDEGFAAVVSFENEEGAWNIGLPPNHGKAGRLSEAVLELHRLVAGALE